MAQNSIPIERILRRLDEYFAKNDYVGAKKHLEYWFNEAQLSSDKQGQLLICNELIGLSRKTRQRETTYSYCTSACALVSQMNIEDSTVAATTYINVATAYKAFGEAEKSLPYFKRAESIYTLRLPPYDRRFGGLYNNMGLTLVDLKRFEEAYECYSNALDIMGRIDNGQCEQAITHLNIASALEAEKGLLDAENEIEERLSLAQSLLDEPQLKRDGYYAFVCEKCAGVFGYYGHFTYENELNERAKQIYERN